MELNDIRDFLNKLVDCEITTHTISRNHQRALGIYPRRGATPYDPGVGCHRFVRVLPVTLLLRWGRNGAEAERAARELHNAIERAEVEQGIVAPVNDAPVWVGADERGVFEYTMDVDFYVVGNNPKH